MFNKVKKQKQINKEISRRKWSCWTAASFAKWTETFKRAEWHPEEYTEGANKRCAEKAMEDLLELHELDPDGCRMVVDSWHNDVNRMIEVLDDNHKYYKVFT